MPLDESEDPAALLEELDAFPSRLERWAERLPADGARRKPAQDTFSFLENVWHLADLEREGYGARIRRLREEEGPFLPDFQGGRLARERRYNERDLTEGLRTFARARGDNLAVLRGLSEPEWDRVGEQEGVGAVRLRDLPRMMREHDRSHRAEIEALLPRRA